MSSRTDEKSFQGKPPMLHQILLSNCWQTNIVTVFDVIPLY